MKLAVFSALGLLLAIFLFCWLIRYVRYSITPRHFKVILFGICLRRVRLTNIDSVSKRRTGGWAENWWNTVRPSHRTLVIRRLRGWPRNLVITPKNRYVFKTALERAVQGVQSGVERSDEAKTLVSD